MINDYSDLLSSSAEDGQLSYENTASNTNSMIDHGSPSTSKSKSNSTSTVSSLSSENAQLKSKNKELRSRLHLMESKYKSNSQSLESELSTTRLEDQETRNALIATVKDLETKLNEQQKMNNNLNKVNRQLQVQITSFLSHVGTKANRNLKNLSDASSLYSELSDSYSERIKELEEQNSSLSSQLEDTAGAAKNKASESARLKKKLKKMKQQQLSMSESNSENANDALTQKKYNKQIRELQSTIEQQKNQIKKLQSQLDRANMNKDDDNSSLSGGKDEIYKANMALLNDRVQSAEQTAAETQKQMQTLRNENQALADRGNMISDQLDEAKEKLAAKEKTISEMKSKMKQMKQVSESMKDEIKCKETENADLDTTVHELQLRVNELENERTQFKLQNKGSKSTNEPTKQYKEKIEMLEGRISSFEELFEKQSQEICELVEQRKQMLSSLLQVDGFLASNDTEMQKLSKDNQSLKEENKKIKEETKKRKETNNDAFKQVYEDSLEVVPPQLKESLKELEGQPHAELFGNYIHILLDAMRDIEKNSQIAKDKSIAKAIRTRYVALLEHLENAYRFLRSVANSQANFGNSDEITREEFLTACARLGKYIEEEKVEFPLEEFKPSIFEPHDIDDPQKVANVFLDFVKHDELESSPIAELFTLFMCVTQVNLILMNNVDANAAAIQQAARVAQLDEEHVEQIRDLEEWKSQQEATNEKLAPILRRLLDEPIPENYEELVNQVTTTVNEEDVPSPTVHKTLTVKIDELEEQIDKLQGEIEKSQVKTENNRTQFCKKAENIVTDVTKQVEAQMKKCNEEKKELEKEIEKLRAKNADTQNQYETRIQKQQRKLAKRDDLINTLKSENESLTQRSMEFQQQLGQHQSQVEEGNDTISGLKQQLQTTKEDLERMTAHKQHYKQRLMEADAANSSTLTDLKQRSEQLTQKYVQTVNDLQKQLQETSNELIKSKEEISNFSDKKREMQEQIAKLQMGKRTAELKQKAADEALVRERALAEAKQNSYALALKSKSDSAIEDLQDDIEKSREIFIRILKEEFDVDLKEDEENKDDKDKNKEQKGNEKNKEKNKDKVPENGKEEEKEEEATIKELIEMIEEELSRRKEEEFAINDALKLRRVMKLDKKASLIDAFKEMSAIIEKEKKRSLEAEQYAAKISNDSEKTQRDSKKLERSVSELNEWTVWSRSMLRQVSETASPNPPGAEVRFRLEEALLASIGQRTVRRKMEILRTEKKLLTSQKPAALKTSSLSKKEKITSIRPMMLSLIFAGRIQQLSGTLPAKYNGMTKGNAPPTTNGFDRRAQRPLVPFEAQ